MNNLFKLLFVAVLCIATNSSFAQYAEIEGISFSVHHEEGISYHISVYHEYDELGKWCKRIYAKVVKPSSGMPEYSGNLVIPDSITEKEENGNERVLPVCYVESNAFAGCKKLHSVVLPNSIKRIGEKAFAGCTELTYVYFPKTAKLEEHVFENCPKLIIKPNDMTINVPKTVIDTIEVEKIIVIRKEQFEREMKEQFKTERSEQLLLYQKALIVR